MANNMVTNAWLATTSFEGQFFLTSCWYSYPTGRYQFKISIFYRGRLSLNNFLILLLAFCRVHCDYQKSSQTILKSVPSTQNHLNSPITAATTNIFKGTIPSHTVRDFLFCSPPLYNMQYRAYCHTIPLWPGVSFSTSSAAQVRYFT